MTTPVDITLLLRYLTGESTEDESRLVQSWCHSSAANSGLLDALRYGGDEEVARLKVDVVRGMERFRNRVDGTLAPGEERGIDQAEAAVRAPRRQLGVFTRQPLLQWIRYGVTGAAIGTLLFIAFRSGRGSWREPSAAPFTLYATNDGQRADIMLPDGSRVTLNVASRLEVPVDYAAGNHTVRLTGEALFTVPHRDATPLSVLTGTITARVLGTTFLVRRYTTDTAAVVAVRDGKVAVGPAVLTAGWRAVVAHGGHPLVQPATAAEFTFAVGKLTLDDLPLSTALVELDRWYDADIRLGDPALASQRMRGEFAAGSIADLAAILELAYDVRVVRDGRVLTLYPRR